MFPFARGTEGGVSSTPSRILLLCSIQLGNIPKSAQKERPCSLFYFILFYFILFYFILFYLFYFYFILFYFILFYFILFYFILFYYLFLSPFFFRAAWHGAVQMPISRDLIPAHPRPLGLFLSACC